MGIYKVKPLFQQYLTPVKDLFVKHRITPTTINLLGLLASIITAIAILASSHSFWYLLIVPFTTTFRTACNALDGLVSRELGLASSFGEVLNEFIDRISDVITTLGFLTLIMVLLNSYMGILSKSAGGPRQYGGLMGKPDRMILISVAALLIVVTHHTQIWNYFLWLVLIGTFITLIQRFLLTKHQLEHMNVNTKS
jgi:CDP-diacylglycerol--glycerol-3-phosphate 3-phosphatidyltransferase